MKDAQKMNSQSLKMKGLLANLLIFEKKWFQNP